MVLLSTSNFIPVNEKQRPLKKLQPKFTGSFPIKAKISSVAYRLTIPSSMKIHLVIHIFLLKQHKLAPPELKRSSEQPPPPILLPNSTEEEYEVQEILDKRRHRGKIQYLVHWKGYPRYDATWEPMSNLKNATEAIQDYLAK